MKPTKVVYLTWWEADHPNPIIQRQVGGLLRELSQLDDLELHLVHAAAFWKARLRGRDLSHLDRLAESLPRVRQQLHNTPLFPRAAQHYATGWVRQHIVTGHTRFLQRIAGDADVVHCRSYPAAWVALQARKRHGLGYRIFFDTRGHYPEEGVITGSYAEDSADFRAWKAMEFELFRDCDVVVNLSEAFSAFVEQTCPAARTATIPSSTPLAAFRDAAQKSPPNERHGLVFLGGLSANGWHSPAALAWLYLAVRDQLERSRLRIITRGDHDAIRAEMHAAMPGVPANELELLASDTLEQTADLLAGARYAALPYNLHSSPVHDLTAHTMTPSKVGEYLAAGLPVLCNARINGPRSLIEQSGAGQIYTQGEAFTLAPPASDEAIQSAAEHFSVRRHAHMYAALYRETV